MKSWLLATGNWFDARLRLRSTLLPMMRHPIPRGAAGPMGWWYVFGSASMTLLLVQIVTGVGLALFYVPSADKAYDSLLALNYDVTLGWFLRALHYYAGSGMVVLVLVHMTQVFLHGAYKYPRELTWVLGVFLLLAPWACSTPARSSAGTRTPTGAWRSAGRLPGRCRSSGRGSSASSWAAR